MNNENRCILMIDYIFNLCIICCICNVLCKVLQKENFQWLYTFWTIKNILSYLILSYVNEDASISVVTQRR